MSQSTSSMNYLLAFISILAAGMSLLLLAGAKSAVHEILAGLAFLIFVVAAAGAAVLGKLEAINQAIRAQSRSSSSGSTESAAKYPLNV